MAIAEFIHQMLRNQHRQYDEAVKDLTVEQLNWLPEGPAVNSIGFTMWHYVRTEDNIVQFILQGRKPTVWIEGGYFERFGLDKIAQGTGMSTADAQALRVPPIAEWMTYQSAVWKATDEYLSSLSDADLASVVKVQPFGEIPAQQALASVCLTHGHAHQGEINVLRVLQGLPSTGI